MQKLIEQIMDFGRDLHSECFDGFNWTKKGVSQEQDYVYRQVLNSIRCHIRESKSKEELIKRMVGMFRAVQDKVVREEGAYKVEYAKMVQKLKPVMRNREFFKQERIIRIIGYKDKG